MYSYYNARTLGIRVPGLIKQAMTMSQLVQFVGMMVQASLLLGMSCPYPKNIVTVYLGYIFSLFLLFSRLFRQFLEQRVSIFYLTLQVAVSHGFS